MLFGLRLCLILSVLGGPLFSEAVFQYDANLSSQKPIKTMRRLVLKHQDAKTFLQALSADKLSEACHVSDQAYSILCSVSDAEYKTLRRYRYWLDKPVNQFEIEVDVYEIAYQQTIRANLGLTKLSENVSYKLEHLEDALNNKGSVLTFLEDFGEAKLLASPRLSVKEGEKASIAVGDRIPFLKERMAYKERIAYVEFINTGVSLTVAPKDVGNQSVNIEIEADVSSVKRWQLLASGSYPVLSRRNAKTNVQMPYNRQLVLAGLIDSQKKNSKQKIPLLGDIPFIGFLFQKTHTETVQSDVIFLIRPKKLSWDPVSKKS